MGIATDTLTVMVHRQERNGLVARPPHSIDRRLYVIVLTDLGREYFGGGHHQMPCLLTAEVKAIVNEEGMNSLKGYLKRLVPQF